MLEAPVWEILSKLRGWVKDVTMGRKILVNWLCLIDIFCILLTSGITLAQHFQVSYHASMSVLFLPYLYKEVFSFCSDGFNNCL